VRQVGSDDERFLALIRAAAELTGLPLIIRSPRAKAVEAAARFVKGTASVLASTTAENADALLDLARENGHALAVTAPDIDGLCELTRSLKDKGFADIVLQFKTRSLAESFQANSIVRRAAIKDNFKPLGYPILRFVDTGNALDDTTAAVTEIAKYGSICVLPGFDAAQLAALMTLRLNIYTDPQKPIQVEPKIYAIGEPNRRSPVFVTTNFSLTYFLVTGEIENSGTSAWLLVPECEGFSVLTAWAAGKFSGAQIAKFVKESGLEELVDTREIVLPGYVAQISGELEESLSGWKALVGPQDAADLEAYIKTVLKRAS
jgi:acetyl-CoA decarbonylase/synthase complex subunit gamma